MSTETTLPPEDPVAQEHWADAGSLPSIGKTAFGRMRRRFTRALVGGIRHWYAALGEALGLVVLTIAAACWLRPHDPLMVKIDFPWLWLVPTVVALRHGTIPAAGACIALLASWPTLQALGLLPEGGNLARFLTVGSVISVLICAQFADVWRWRLRKVREVNAYLDERLNELTRAHYLLKLSHQRIEQELLRRPASLRDLLEQQRMQHGREGETLPGADALLQMLAQTCELESAAIFACDERGRLLPTACSRLASIASLREDDPVLLRALEQGQLAHIAQHGAAGETTYLVAAPLLASSKKLLGMVLIERLPFLALNQENLQMLSVLVGYYSDGVQAGGVIQPLREVCLEIPDDFALELRRLDRLAREHRVQSALVGLTFPKTIAGATLQEQVKRMRRSMDLAWEFNTEHRTVYFTLLSLAGSPAVEGYLMRVEAAFKAQHGLDFGQAGVAVHYVPVDGHQHADMLLRDGLARVGLSRPDQYWIHNP